LKVSLIVAISDNGVIGRRQGLPWRLSSDLRRFKALTFGHHLLMGRKTFESIGRALPGRSTVVISRGQPPLPAGVSLVSSLEAAIEIALRAGDDEAFVAGGAEVFRAALPLAERVYRTVVRASVDGDTRFPELGPSLESGGWRLVQQQEVAAGDRDDHPTTFEIWERKSRS